jgi:hypothetical protein
MIWSMLFGTDMLILVLQFEGGIQNYVLYVVTLLARQGK